MKIDRWKILIFFLFLLKTLIVGTRLNRLIEAVRTSAHYPGFRAVIRKLGISMQTLIFLQKVYYIKVGFEGG